MKYCVFCIIGHSTSTDDVISSLSNAGYKGTLIPSTSLRKTLLKEDDTSMFINLSGFDVDNYENNTTIIIVEEEDKIDEILELIQDATGNWTKCSGCSFVLPLTKFEGSF